MALYTLIRLPIVSEDVFRYNYYKSMIRRW